jgi:hypothetical protein
MSYTEKYKVNLPEGSAGDWRVEKRIIEDNTSLAVFNMHARGRAVPPGTYTYLLHRGHVIMSDTPAEIRDLYPIIRQAKGQVLINGLGLGVVLQAILEKPETEHVTVIELSEEIIALIGTYYQERYGKKLDIVHADALEWKAPKGARYDVVWHDIWPDLCIDNLEDMKKLHRKYGRRCDWQGSWCREILEYRKRQEEKSYY